MGIHTYPGVTMSGMPGNPNIAQDYARGHFSRRKEHEESTSLALRRTHRSSRLHDKYKPGDQLPTLSEYVDPQRLPGGGSAAREGVHVDQRAKERSGK
jgi:hypothetical protein